MYVLCSPMELHVAQCLMGVAWKLLTGQLDLQQDAPVEPKVSRTGGAHQATTASC